MYIAQLQDISYTSEGSRFLNPFFKTPMSMAVAPKFTAIFSKRHQRLLVFLLAIVFLLCLDFSDDEAPALQGNPFLPGGQKSVNKLFQGGMPNEEADQHGMQGESVTIKR